MTTEAAPVRKGDVSLRRIPSAVAAAVSEQHHYIGRARVGRIVAFGVYHQERYNGVLVYALPMVCRPMFGYAPGEIIELARVWFASNPKNLGSCAIRKSLPMLQARWPGCKAVVSWCDTTRFDGALYKASGFEFMGESRVRGVSGGRPDRKVHDDRLHVKTTWLIRLRDNAVAQPQAMLL